MDLDSLYCSINNRTINRGFLSDVRFLFSKYPRFIVEYLNKRLTLLSKSVIRLSINKGS